MIEVILKGIKIMKNNDPKTKQALLQVWHWVFGIVCFAFICFYHVDSDLSS